MLHFVTRAARFTDRFNGSALMRAVLQGNSMYVVADSTTVISGSNPRMGELARITLHLLLLSAGEPAHDHGVESCRIEKFQGFERN